MVLHQTVKTVPGVCSPTTLANGQLETGDLLHKKGENVRETCNEGYATKGNTTTCQADGTWDPPPSCTQVTCPVPDLTDGHYTLNKNVVSNGTMVTYISVIQPECNSGYELNTNIRHLTCLGDGTWGSIIPVCNESRCNDTRGVKNVAVIKFPALRFGEEANMAYNSEHFLLTEGSMAVTCLQNRHLKWIHSPVFGTILSRYILAITIRSAVGDMQLKPI